MRTIGLPRLSQMIRGKLQRAPFSIRRFTTGNCMMLGGRSPDGLPRGIPSPPTGARYENCHSPPQLWYLQPGHQSAALRN